MRKALLFLPGLVLAATALLTGGVGSAQAPTPTAGTLLADGLGGMFGGAIGPDGAFYAAVGGTGGDTVLSGPEGDVFFGETGSIVRIDPATGAVTTAVDGIGSFGFAEGEGSGVVDVVFMGSTMYFMTSVGGEAGGSDEWPVGIYRANADGSFTLIADLGAFNLANMSPTQEIPTGNPFGLATRGDTFLVTDGNANRVLSVTLDGDIDVLSQFGNVVPTGVVSGATGPIYITFYSPAPHTTGTSSLVAVDAATGAVTTIDTGTELIGVDFSSGTIYVVSMGDEPTDPEGPPAEPFTGTLFRLVNGQLIPVATGFMLPISLTISNNTAFIATLTGEVWKVENLSSLQDITPPTPTPTATPTQPAPATATATTAAPTTAAPGPPATGTGVSTGAGPNWALLALAVAALGTAGASLVASRARR